MSDKKKILLGTLATIAGNAIWGSGTLFTRTALQTVRPMQLLAMRFTVAFLAIHVWLLLSGQRIRLPLKNRKLMFLGLIEPLCLISEGYGILYTNASFAGIMVATVPIFAIFLAAQFLHEYPTRAQLLFCVLPIAGVIIITLAGKSLGVVSALGVFFLFLQCLGMGGFKVLNRGISHSCTATERTYVMMLFCMLIFDALALVEAKGDLAALAAPLRDMHVLLPALYLGVVCSVTANLLVNFGVSYISVTRASSFSALSTLTAALGGVLILHEPMSLMAVVGGVLIVVGVWQVTRRGQ